MFGPDFYYPFRLGKLREQFTLAPREGGPMINSILFVLSRFLEFIRMPLHQAHPFDFLLKEAERAAAPRSPFIIFGESGFPPRLAVQVLQPCQYALL